MDRYINYISNSVGRKRFMADVADTIHALVDRHDLSDIHIKADEPISLRINGDIVPSPGGEITTAEDIQSFTQTFLSEKQQSHLNEFRDQDLAIEVAGFRFRANFFYTSTGLAIALRKIETEIPSMEKLNLPLVAQEVANKPNGLVLVTGPTGSGKTTSLAAMMGYINQTRKGHILTIEDPVEYIHKSEQCIVAQREIGRDAYSFTHALRAALREDPDVILVGEMRDLETVQLALTAAETGHLVFGTLHTSGAPNTINRIIDVFPPQQQDQVRAQLSQSLRMVMTQRLFKRSDGNGRIAAFEVMICNHAIRNMIREGKIPQITNALQTGKAEGMITMEKAIEELVHTGKIDESNLSRE